MILDLIQNVALLVSLVVGLQMLARRLVARPWLYRAVAGVLFGGVCIVGMMMPMHFAPGVIYDARSVILSLAGLFGGPLAAAVAVVMAGAFRAYLGGAGAVVGVLTILESAGLGVLLYYLRRRDERWVRWWRLLAFGVLVHVGVLALQLLLPEGKGWQVLRQVGPIVMLFYPLGFLLVSLVFLESERRRRDQEELREEHERLRFVIDGARLGTWVWNIRTGKTYFNDTWAEMLGYSLEELKPLTEEVWERLVHEEDLPETKERLQRCIDGDEPFYEYEHRMRHKAGHWVWILDRGRVMTRDKAGRPLSMFGTHTDITERKTSEEQIRRREKLLRTILHTAVDGYWVVNTDGIITDVNASYCAMSGYSREEILGMSIRDLDATDSPAQISTRIARIRRNGSEVFTVRHRRKDGSVFPVEISATYVEENNGMFVCFCRDLTERMANEAQLAVMAEMLNEAPASITIHDTTGRFLFANQRTLELHGYESEEEFLAVNLHDLDVPESEALLEERFRQIEKTGEAFFEVAHYRKDGSVFPLEVLAKQIDWNGQVALLSIASDITQRKEAERALRESEKKFRSLVETTIDWVWQTDPQGRYVYASPNAVDLIGYAPEEIIGKTPFDFMEENEQQRVAEILGPIMSERKRIVGLEDVMVRKDGSHVYYETNATPVYDADGQFEGYFGTCRDITKRKLAEESLRETTLQLQETIRAGQVGLWDWDLKTDTVDYSPEWKRQIGYEDHEIGNTLEEWERRVHPDDLEATKAQITRMIQSASENYDVEFRFRHKDGSYRWILAQALVHTDETGQPVRVMGSHIDITERKEAEEILRLSEERYRSLAENFPNGALFLVDRNYRYLAADGRAFEQAGLRQEEIVGKTVAEVFPELWDVLKPKIDRAYWGEDEYYEVEYRGRLYSNQIVPMEIREGSAQQVIVIAQDITDQRQAEEKRRESEDRYRSLVMQSADCLLLHDLDGWIKDVNPCSCRTYGYSREELLSMNISDLDPDYDQRADGGHFYDQMRSEEPVVFEARQKTRAGRILIVEVRLTPVEFGGQSLIQGLCRDITAQKRSEEEQERLRTQLAQAQKMEAVGRLAGGVAHDFNNKLQAILGYTSMLLSRIGDDHPFRADLEEIHKAGVHSADLTRQLLAFARKQTVSPQVLDINRTVGDMLRMLERLVGEHIELKWSPCESACFVNVDPVQVDQVLTNLVVNSRDAIAEKGRIIIETDHAVLDETYCSKHPGFQPGSYAVLSVSDDGVGMDRETQQQAFEPFFTTKTMDKGTGLGLATVYGIVKQNNGFVNLYSEPGEGTTVRIYLPVSEERPEKKPTPVSGSDHAGGSETVLLVEDEPALLKLGTDTLRKMGYTVLSANNGRKALKIAREYTGHIDVLVSDVIMPNMSGRELWETLRREHGDLRCLFVSGYSKNVIANHGVLDADVQFLQKPFSVTDLAGKLREILSPS